MTMCDMAREYRKNISLMELRVIELQTALRKTRQREVKYRLKKRIGYLRMLINESRKEAFVLEHYYDRRGGEAYACGRAV